jgi:hypothetical protein
MEHRKRKLTCSSYQVKDQKSNLKFWTSLTEGITHGITIAVVVLLTLPNARLPGGKLFPVQALHFSIYFLLVSVSVLRHMVSRHCSHLAVLLLALVSYTLLLGVPWLMALGEGGFRRTAVQMGLIWTTYDSVLMLVNVVIFCLGCSLFIGETRKKGVVSIVLEHVLKLRRENARLSRQLLEKDINYV